MLNTNQQAKECPLNIGLKITYSTFFVEYQCFNKITKYEVAPEWKH